MVGLPFIDEGIQKRKQQTETTNNMSLNETGGTRVGEEANPKQTLTVSPNRNRGRTSQFVGKTLVNPSSIAEGLVRTLSCWWKG